MVLWWLGCGFGVGSVGISVPDTGVDPSRAAPPEGTVPSEASWTLDVQDVDSLPLADHRVELYFPGGPSTASLTTDAAGRVGETGLAPGVYGVRVVGALTAAWVFTVEAGDTIAHTVRLPEPGFAVPLPDPAEPVTVGAGLVVLVDELLPPPFEPPTTTLSATRVEPPLPFDGRGTVVGNWLFDPYDHTASNGMAVGFSLPADTEGPLEVWQPDLPGARWRRVGTVDGPGLFEGDAVLDATLPVVLVAPPQ
ncbi:MAG: carboxypeptidase-like regulatory domain-containing protein [Myxococcota bacterium]